MIRVADSTSACCLICPRSEITPPSQNGLLPFQLLLRRPVPYRSILFLDRHVIGEHLCPSLDQLQESIRCHAASLIRHEVNPPNTPLRLHFFGDIQLLCQGQRRPIAGLVPQSTRDQSHAAGPQARLSENEGLRERGICILTASWFPTTSGCFRLFRSLSRCIHRRLSLATKRATAWGKRTDRSSGTPSDSRSEGAGPWSRPCIFCRFS